MGADAVLNAEGNNVGAEWPGVQFPPWSENGACTHGDSPGTRETPPSPRKYAGKENQDKSLQAHPGVPTCHESKSKGTTAVPSGEETKLEGKGDGESEHLIVPLKSGNTPQWTRRREGDACLWTRWRE